MKGIPAYTLLVKVAKGVCPSSVCWFTTLDTAGHGRGVEIDGHGTSLWHTCVGMGHCFVNGFLGSIVVGHGRVGGMGLYGNRACVRAFGFTKTTQKNKPRIHMFHQKGAIHGHTKSTCPSFQPSFFQLDIC